MSREKMVTPLWLRVVFVLLGALVEWWESDG